MPVRRWSARARALVSAAVVLGALAACKGKSQQASVPMGPTDDGQPFADAVPPSVYVPKVKLLLTGLAATPAEVQAVTADQAALRRLIELWMNDPASRPRFEARMLDFFRNAFQQNNLSLDAVASSLMIPDFYLPWRDRRRLENVLMDSFPRTAWQLVQEGVPFNQTVTTRRYLMTTAMMSALSYADMFSVDDAGDRTERLTQATDQQLVFDPRATGAGGLPLTEADSVAQFRPGGTGPWTWRLNLRNVSAACAAEIDGQHLKVTPSEWERTSSLFGIVFGGQSLEVPENDPCQWNGADTNAPVPLLWDGDWSDWRWVTVESIPAGDTTSLPSPLFWDLPSLRAANTLKLRTPRIGFFGTLAWAGNWPTNESNQARVTANQTLIVAIGESIIPAGAIAPAPVTASDAAHSTDPACAACHLVLDPLRQFFRQDYTFSYHEQLDRSQTATGARFLLDGMNVSGRGVADLGSILATHPHYAIAWAQKLQFWATSNPAAEDDPELQRIALAFQRSNFSFKVLVQEVFSSPLVTLSGGVKTYRDQGVTVGIARRDQLCAAYSAKFGLADACHLRTADSDWSDIAQAGQLIATDTYYRAAELPSLPRNPDLFFRVSVEAVCGRLADQLISWDTSGRYSTTDQAGIDAAIDDFVATVMNLPSTDARAASARTILASHYAAALASTDQWNRVGALRSTFVLACISPTSVLVGL